MKAAITKNERFGSLEIRFDEKPDAAAREALRARRFRWNPTRGIWYGYGDEEEIRAALDRAAEQNDGEKTDAEQKQNRTADKKQNSKPEPELLAEIRGYYEKVWKGSPHIVDYCVGKISDAVKLGNGFIIEIEKESIKKDFCFGYGCQSMSEEEANDAARTAGESENYFKYENMKHFRDVLKMIDGGDPNGWANYTFVLLDHYDESENLKSIRFCRVCELLDCFGGCADLEAIKGTFCTFEGRRAYIPTDADRKAIRAAYVSAMEKHEKRVDAYLKRYGMAHVNTWSYWADA